MTETTTPETSASDHLEEALSLTHSDGVKPGPLATASGAELLALARLYAKSDLVPQQFRGSPPNVYVALRMSQNMGLDEFTTMQNLDVIRGKASWSSKFLISLANSKGPFRGPLRFVTIGEGDGMAVRCEATLSSGEIVSRTVSYQDAREAGWVFDKNGNETAVWKSIREQMLSYRSAAFLVRLYCPEVTLGLPPADEVEDVHRARSREGAITVEAEAPTKDLDELVSRRKAPKPKTEEERRAEIEEATASASKPTSQTKTALPNAKATKAQKVAIAKRVQEGLVSWVEIAAHLIERGAALEDVADPLDSPILTREVAANLLDDIDSGVVSDPDPSQASERSESEAESADDQLFRGDEVDPMRDPG